ncbi:membrane protein [Agarivorans sp. Toyoura001]|uniref:DUF1007 family protein n=1 Tax=Agarivorans sp. Toyoura001 TaxID=2283141 RepID=UPI0010E49402|nr:DUF1007 family protein [Agarivorans sp. Toyoura001]GDY26641.1 membrane protein [Agarivorans sp. Toyoura001]
MLKTNRALWWVAMLCMAPLLVSAHPHSWIDVRSYVDGKNQQINGVSMVWQFDPMTSAYMLDGEDLDGVNRQLTLTRMAQDLVINISDFDYFTKVYWNQQPVELAGASMQRVTIEGLKVSFSFYLSFKQPISMHAISMGQGTLDIRVFDPSYYIDMSWRDSNDLALAIELQAACSQKIIEPSPSSEQMSYALALPADASPDNALGKLFTQQGVITCESL